MKDFKVGDRFKFSKFGFWCVWQIDFDGTPIVIDRGNMTFPDNYKNDQWVVSSDDEYLGNFSKSNKFKEIYEILNG